MINSLTKQFKQYPYNLKNGEGAIVLANNRSIIILPMESENPKMYSVWMERFLFSTTLKTLQSMLDGVGRMTGHHIRDEFSISYSDARDLMQQLSKATNAEFWPESDMPSLQIQASRMYREKSTVAQHLASLEARQRRNVTYGGDSSLIDPVVAGVAGVAIGATFFGGDDCESGDGSGD